jgi:TolB-like protein
MAERPFPAYKGDQPYIFVSYAHEDAEFVYPELKWLNDRGINVWYDEGISPGSRWSDALAQALADSAHFVFFVSPRSASSHNCLDEVGFALEREKPLLAVHVEPTELPAGLALRLGSRQAIMRYELNEAAYREKLGAALADYAGQPEIETKDGGLSPHAEIIERLCSSLAVIAFENRSDDPDLEALSEAIAEDVTDTLAGMWPGQRLIGGRETLRYRDDAASARDVAEELKVGVVLKGSMRKLGANVRISAELVNAEGEQVWSHRFNEPLESVFEHHDRIVDMIVWGMSDGQRRYLFKRTAEMPADELGPWGLYYKAWQRYDIADAKGRADNRQWTERAIALDPYQPIFKGNLAFWIANNVMQGFSLEREADTRRALELAEEAARSGIGFALLDAGHAFGFLGDHERAVALCRRAYEMVPRFVPAKWALALRLLYAGAPHEAVQLYHEAEALKLPGQNSPYWMITQCHFVLGNLDEALETGRVAINRSDTLGAQIIAFTAYANALACANRIDEAARMIDRIRQAVPRLTIRGAINAYRRAYGTEEGREAVTRGLEKLIDLGYE